MNDTILHKPQTIVNLKKVKFNPLESIKGQAVKDNMKH